jgi:hypothetical protein
MSDRVQVVLVGSFTVLICSVLIYAAFYGTDPFWPLVAAINRAHY